MSSNLLLSVGGGEGVTPAHTTPVVLLGTRSAPYAAVAAGEFDPTPPPDPDNTTGKIDVLMTYPRMESFVYRIRLRIKRKN